jgi:hypothetical protein
VVPELHVRRPRGRRADPAACALERLLARQAPDLDAAHARTRGDLPIGTAVSPGQRTHAGSGDHCEHDGGNEDDASQEASFRSV